MCASAGFAVEALPLPVLGTLIPPHLSHLPRVLAVRAAECLLPLAGGLARGFEQAPAGATRDSHRGSDLALLEILHALRLFLPGHKALVALLSLEAPGGAAGASGALAAAGGPAARAMWVAVLVLCAPLWEELMFRGFLLPALARRAPPAAAVGLSALAFALVHFSREGFLPLLALGCVFGAAYARTGNLAAPVALHAGWNVYLLVQVL